MADHVTRYNKMPIPAIDAHTRHFEAGALRIGVEYRVLDEQLTAVIRPVLEDATGGETGKLTENDDRGVSLHVYVLGNDGWREHLRFDCFEEEPHYHYVSWAEKRNEVYHLDAVADGDALAWALDRIAARLPYMLRHAEPGSEALVNAVDLETLMPRVVAAAYAARFDVNPDTARFSEAGRPREDA
jgi:hypothetical protein